MTFCGSPIASLQELALKSYLNSFPVVRNGNEYTAVLSQLPSDLVPWLRVVAEYILRAGVEMSADMRNRIVNYREWGKTSDALVLIRALFQSILFQKGSDYRPYFKGSFFSDKEEKPFSPAVSLACAIEAQESESRGPKIYRLLEYGVIEEPSFALLFVQTLHDGGSLSEKGRLRSLDTAIRKRHDFTIVQALLAHGPELRSCGTSFISSAIYMAASHNATEIMRALVADGPTSEEHRKVAIKAAVSYQRLEMVQQLIAESSDPARYKKIAIEYAAQSGCGGSSAIFNALVGR